MFHTQVHINTPSIRQSEVLLNEFFSAYANFFCTFFILLMLFVYSVSNVLNCVAVNTQY